MRMSRLLCSRILRMHLQKGPRRQQQRGEGATTASAGAGHCRLSPAASGTLSRLSNLERNEALSVLAIHQNKHGASASSLGIRNAAFHVLRRVDRLVRYRDDNVARLNALVG